MEDSYQTELGTPTLTLRMGSLERMIPWASFLGGSFHRKEGGENENILLSFQEGEVRLKGYALQHIWEKCQLQDLRWVREIPGALAEEWTGEGVVIGIRFTTPDDQESEPPSGIH